MSGSLGNNWELKNMKAKMAGVFVTAFLAASLALASGVSTDPKFQSGDLTLSGSMFGKGASGAKMLQGLYERGAWSQLVDAVAEQGFVVDTYYFYLGRAAEELGHKLAAKKYYEIVAKLKGGIDTCSTGPFYDTCHNFKFPADALRRIAQLTTVERAPGKPYDLKSGPSIKDMRLPTPEGLRRFVDVDSTKAIERGKFESDEDFARRSLSGSLRFLVVDVPASDQNRCVTNYDHQTSTYKVFRCEVMNGLDPIGVELVEGPTFTLANAYDKREISTKRVQSYKLNTKFTWSASFQIPPVEAQALENDLAVGIELSNVRVKSSCDVCGMRKLQNNLGSIAESLAAISGKSSGPTKDWKDDAFKGGSVTEYWDYSIEAEKVVRVIVFRKSDLRVVYEESALN